MGNTKQTQWSSNIQEHKDTLFIAKCRIYFFPAAGVRPGAPLLSGKKHLSLTDYS
jgi:hypothetical protein